MRWATWLAIGWLALLHLAVLGAGFLAPYDPSSQLQRLPHVPPTYVHLDLSGLDGSFRPFVCGWAPEGDSYREDCGRRYAIEWFAGGHLFRAASPGAIYVMGTDSLGRDQFSRFLHGGRVSLFAGALATLIAMSLGTVLGMWSGYQSGLIDELVTGLSEVFLSLPWLFLLFAVRAALPLHFATHQAFLLIVLLIGAVGWARPARVVRAVVLSTKERGFVQAARGFGGSTVHILRTHLWPDVKGVCLTYSALLWPKCVVSEITLSFLGLGVSEPGASWGVILASIHYASLPSNWWLAVPVLPMCLTFVAVVRVSYTLRFPEKMLPELPKSLTSHVSF
jgi:peptide/nickel transport system permease protein